MNIQFLKLECDKTCAASIVRGCMHLLITHIKFTENIGERRYRNEA